MTRLRTFACLGVLLATPAWGQTPTPLGEIRRPAYQEPEGPPAPRAPIRARATAKAAQAPAGGQVLVPCWYVPNGAAITLQCANGFWQTIMPDGLVVTGHGMPDPNEAVRGSGLVINPGTGGPYIGNGPTVTPPTQVVPTPAPGQASQYGLPPLEQ